MVPTVVLFYIVVRDEKFGALIALEEVRLLLGRQFKQVLVGGKRLLFDFKFLLQRLVFLCVKLDLVSDFEGVLVRLFIVEVKGLCKSFEVVLSVDEILN